jgi:hypothetical protein
MLDRTMTRAAARLRAVLTACSKSVVGDDVRYPGRRRPWWTSCGCRSRCWLTPEAGRQAIRPYGVWHEGNPYARPAVIIVAPGGPAEALPVLD